MEPCRLKPVMVAVAPVGTPAYASRLPVAGSPGEVASATGGTASGVAAAATM